MVNSCILDQLDHALGKIMNHLEGRGELKNTIIVFKTTKSFDRDSSRSKHYRWGKLYDFKKHKDGSAYDGNLKSTVIIYYPKKIPMGKKINRTAGIDNLLPTVASLTSIKYEDYYEDNEKR